MKALIVAASGIALGVALTTGHRRYWWPGLMFWLFSKGDQ